MICKLCGGLAISKFVLPLFNDGWKAQYYECDKCHLLQSYHLDTLSAKELTHYYGMASPDMDAGAACRQYGVVTRIEQMVKLGIIPRSIPGFKMLDYGCGSGFVASYLKARFGWETLGYDPYSRPAYMSNGFTSDWSEVTKGRYHLVIAVEVFEHFINIKEEVARIQSVLSKDFAFVYVMTGMYIPGKYDRNWWYLAPQSGQHVSIYSADSRQEIKRLLGVDAVYQIGTDSESLFVRHRNARIALMSMLLRMKAKLC